MSRSNDRDTLKGIIRFEEFHVLIPIPLPSRYCSPPIVATILPSWYNALLPFTVKNVQLVFHRPPTFTHDQFKTTRGTYLQCPLFRQEFWQRMRDNFAYKNSESAGFIINTSYWNAWAIVVVRFYVPLNVMLAYLQRTGCVSLHFTLFPQRREGFLLSTIVFSFFFFNFLYYSSPCDCAILSRRVRVESRKLFTHFLLIVVDGKAKSNSIKDWVED